MLGNAAMPQLSLACFSPEDALRRMEDKEFICETKFDGVLPEKRFSVLRLKVYLCKFCRRAKQAALLYDQACHCWISIRNVSLLV